jgi:hypothetical protein
MRHGRQRLTTRQRYWLDHLEACEASGQKMNAYAQAQGLGARALYDARKRLVKQGVLSPARADRPGFQRVRVTAATAAAPCVCRIRLPNGVSIEMSGAHVDWGALLKPLSALR